MNVIVVSLATLSDASGSGSGNLPVEPADRALTCPIHALFPARRMGYRNAEAMFSVLGSYPGSPPSGAASLVTDIVWAHARAA